VMPAAQAPEALENLRCAVHAQDAFELTALQDLVSLSGSLVLGLAAQRGACEPSEIWQISRVDEAWQAELWGADDEAEAMAEVKRAAFMHAQEFYCLVSEN